MKVSVVQFSMRQRSTSEDFWTDVTRLLDQSIQEQSRLVIFPEYCCLPLIALHTATDETFSDGLRTWAKEKSAVYLETWRSLANRYKINICLGSFPVFEGENLLNRAVLCTAEGQTITQDKIHLTRFECEDWQVNAGERRIKVFNLDGFRCAIFTCFDVEFPELSAAVAQAAVDVLIVPSCTDSWHGYWRVRHCASARATELQAFSAMSTCIQGDSRFPDIAEHQGAAAIFSPCDVPFTFDGVMTCGGTQESCLLTAELLLTDLHRLRTDGSVLNLKWHSGEAIVVEILR